MKRVSPSTVAIIALVVTASSAPAARLRTTHAADVVVANDNRRSAGVLTGNTLTLRLRAGLGSWRPEGAAGPVLQVEAFGEEGATLQSPAPLIRVPKGTEIVASIRNDLDAPLRVHGLCTKNGSPCAPIEVPISGVREVRFAAGDAGTYHYWATSSAMPIQFRGSTDTQLSGAFVVDAADAAPDADRVLVITEWTSLTRAQLRELAGADDVGVAFRALNPRITFLPLDRCRGGCASSCSPP